MSGLEQRKRRRENEFTKSNPSIHGAMDLFVQLPTMESGNASLSSIRQQQSGTRLLTQTKLIEQVLSRLQDTGYRYIALTHVINGQPHDPNDRCKNAIPDLTSFDGILKGNVVLLRRLHVVVENISDMTIFNPQSLSQQQLLAEYDLISIAPRNDVVFQAACTCDHVDIVTLDGSMSTSNALPYTIRSTDVRSIRERNAVFEIPYAVPILNRNARKGLVQTCRNLITASLGGGNDMPLTSSKIPLSFGSGKRSTSGSNASVRQSDVGSVAFRTPDDLVNVVHTILSLDMTTAIRSMTESGQLAINHGIARRQRREQQLHNQANMSQQRLTITAIGITRQGRHVLTTPKSKKMDIAERLSLDTSRETRQPFNDRVSAKNELSADEEGFISL